MACKLIILSALLIAVATAAPQPGYYHTSHEVPEHHQYEAPAHSGFKYEVHDAHTGDIKTQHEERDGDSVRGEYALVEPDGTIRTVKYIADKHTGFHAEVHRDPPKYSHEIYHK